MPHCGRAGAVGAVLAQHQERNAAAKNARRNERNAHRRHAAGKGRSPPVHVLHYTSDQSECETARFRDALRVEELHHQRVTLEDQVVQDLSQLRAVPELARTPAMRRRVLRKVAQCSSLIREHLLRMRRIRDDGTSDVEDESGAMESVPSAQAAVQRRYDRSAQLTETHAAAASTPPPQPREAFVVEAGEDDSRATRGDAMCGCRIS